MQAPSASKEPQLQSAFRTSFTQVTHQPLEGPYNSLHSLEIGGMYLNETGMDSMPTNFNKRETSTSQG